MRILIVSQYFWPENFRINDLCLALKERGHEVTVLTGIPNYPEGRVFSDYRKNPKSFERFHGVNIVRVPMVSRGNSKLSLLLNYLSFMISCSFIGFLKVRKDSFDMVFVCQLSPATVAIPGIVISKLKGIPLAIWILDLWPDSLKAVGIVKNDKTLGILQAIMNFIYKQCDLILVQSRSFKEIIDYQITSNKKVKYVPTWAEDNFSTKIITNNIRQQGNCFTITFAGNIGNAQDIYCIIYAANELKKFPKIKFQIIGGGREVNAVKKTINRLGLQKNVHLMGRHPLEAMPQFFQNSDAMLVTLQAKKIFSMTIPGKLQSYLAAGKPIIGAINGEARAVIENSQSGYCVEAGDYVGLAESILKMANATAEQLKEFGANGRRYYEKEFSREKILDKFEKSFLNLIS